MKKYFAIVVGSLIFPPILILLNLCLEKGYGFLMSGFFHDKLWPNGTPFTPDATWGCVLAFWFVLIMSIAFSNSTEE